MHSMRKPLSTPDALELIRQGQTIFGFDLVGPFDLSPLAIDDKIHQTIRIENCVLNGIQASCMHFISHLSFHGCIVQTSWIQFFATYFLGGLSITDCSFETEVNFECGGHNQNGSTFAIEGTRFTKFVSFSDSWYEGPVMIRNCQFLEGSNLLGNLDQPYIVRFDVPPVIEGNEGQLALNLP